MRATMQSLQWKILPAAAVLMLGAAWVSTSCTTQSPKVAADKVIAQSKREAGSAPPSELAEGGPVACVLPPRDPLVMQAGRMIEEGRKTFRFDTFGDEAFWGDALKLHLAIAGEKNGGVGLGVSPQTALAVGLKVDSEALPAELNTRFEQGQVDLSDPSTTLALLRLNAVVGVTGFFAEDGALRSFGIQCALCHSTVDDSIAAGVGKRLDGWANRDLDIGALIAIAPDLSPLTGLLGLSDETVRTVLNS